MGGHYEKGLYDQLMDVMARLDAMETEHKKDHAEIRVLTAEVAHLRKENSALLDKASLLKEENAALEEKCQRIEKECSLLREDNERMKSILNNDSSNTSNPPSTDQKGGKPANTYNGREKTEGSKAAKKGTGAARLPGRLRRKRSARGNASIK